MDEHEDEERGVTSPGGDGQKGLRLQFNSRQSSTVDAGVLFSARHIEYATEYSTCIHCHMAGRQPTPGLEE
eukprot:6888332-Pyramimonas_sp.AAC.1